MENETALEIIRQAAELAPLNKQSHIQIEQALQVIKQALEEKKEVKEKKEK